MTIQSRSVLGPRPAFAEPLHVGRPNIGNAADIHRRIDKILQRRWLSNDGPLVLEFERRIAALVGVKHCLAVCNATVGLELAYQAAGLSGEVIVPANTFVATVHALQRLGITPVFCDIDPETHNLDPRRVEGCITPRTTGVVGVHVWGRPCEASALEEISEHYGLRLLFDAAHAFGCSHEGRMIGQFGDAEVFSFHATKFVNSGEGGAIVTNNDAIAARLRQLRNFGIAGCDHVVSLGTNGKMSEFAAAVGLTSLESMPEFLAINDRNYRAYCQALADVPGVRVVEFNPGERNNFQYVVVAVDQSESPLTRDQWLQVLHGENVLARRYFYPGVHRMEPYRSQSPLATTRLPVTDAVLQKVLVLPTGTAVSERNIGVIGQIFMRAIAAASRLTHTLPAMLPLPTVPLASLEREAA
jgi:dTDP-4-amino-4,6-dideoxygalactose transaminase